MFKCIENMRTSLPFIAVICFTVFAPSLKGVLGVKDEIALDDCDLLTIIRRLKYLEARDQEHERDNEMLRLQVSSYREELTMLNDKNSDLAERVSVSESSNAELRKHLYYMEMSLETLKGRFDTTDDNETTHIQQSATKILDNVEPRAKRMENEGTVAFYATLTTNLEHLGAKQNIVFDDVITNLGNAYNVHVGDFRAPFDGTYVFSVTLTTYGTHSNHYRFVRNGITVGHMYNRGLEAPFASASLNTVLQLQAGDSIAVTNVEPDEYLYGSSFSAFSGFLLQEDYAYPAIVG